MLQTIMADVHAETLQLHESLAQVRPGDVLDNGITKKQGVDEVQAPLAQPKQPNKTKAKGKDTVPSVSYFKLFRLCYFSCPNIAAQSCSDVPK